MRNKSTDEFGLPSGDELRSSGLFYGVMNEVFRRRDVFVYYHLKDGRSLTGLMSLPHIAPCDQDEGLSSKLHTIINSVDTSQSIIEQAIGSALDQGVALEDIEEIEIKDGSLHAWDDKDYMCYIGLTVVPNFRIQNMKPKH